MQPVAVAVTRAILVFAGLCGAGVLAALTRPSGFDVHAIAGCVAHAGAKTLVGVLVVGGAPGEVGVMMNPDLAPVIESGKVDATF